MIDVNILDFSDLDISCTLHLPNREIIGEFSSFNISNYKTLIDDVDFVELDIYKYTTDSYTGEKIEDPIFNDIDYEKLLCLNDNSFFVIKDISYVNVDSEYKIVKAYSSEIKLQKNDVILENTGIVIEGEYEDSVSFSDILYNNTRWKLGNVDDSVKYKGNLELKYRWIESLNSTWYDFINEFISDNFECIPVFDTLNKAIHLYDIYEYGSEASIYLSRDNYIESLEKNGTTMDIVTRLSVFGKDESSISKVNPTGLPYIENYSYFIDNNYMSKELSNALSSYNEIINEIHKEWISLLDKKGELQSSLLKVKSEWLPIIEQVKYMIKIRDDYYTIGDVDNTRRYDSLINENNFIKHKLELNMIDLEKQINSIDIRINEINKQLDKSTVRGENGVRLFPDHLLDELSEFIYYDSYNNDAITDVNELYDIGDRELKLRCSPEVEFNIDSILFYKNIDLDTVNDVKVALGHSVILNDSDKNRDVSLYVVAIEFTENLTKLKLHLSTKKNKTNDSKIIGDLLNKSMYSMDFVKSKKYILNQIKYNKII